MRSRGMTPSPITSRSLWPRVGSRQSETMDGEDAIAGLGDAAFELGFLPEVPHVDQHPNSRVIHAAHQGVGLVQRAEKIHVIRMDGLQREATPCAAASGASRDSASTARSAARSGLRPWRRPGTAMTQSVPISAATSSPRRASSSEPSSRRLPSPMKFAMATRFAAGSSCSRRIAAPLVTPKPPACCAIRQWHQAGGLVASNIGGEVPIARGDSLTEIRRCLGFSLAKSTRAPCCCARDGDCPHVLDPGGGPVESRRHSSIANVRRSRRSRDPSRAPLRNASQTSGGCPHRRWPPPPGPPPRTRRRRPSEDRR